MTVILIRLGCIIVILIMLFIMFYSLSTMNLPLIHSKENCEYYLPIYINKLSGLYKPLEFKTMVNDGPDLCRDELDFQYIDYIDDVDLFIK